MSGIDKINARIQEWVDRLKISRQLLVSIGAGIGVALIVVLILGWWRSRGSTARKEEPATPEWIQRLPDDASLTPTAGPGEQQEDAWTQYSSPTDGIAAAFPGEITREEVELANVTDSGTQLQATTADGTYYTVTTIPFDTSSGELAQAELFTSVAGDDGGAAAMTRLTVGGYPAAQYDDHDEETGIYRRTLTIALPTRLVTVSALSFGGEPTDFDYFVSTLQLNP